MKRLQITLEGKLRHNLKPVQAIPVGKPQIVPIINLSNFFKDFYNDVNRAPYSANGCVINKFPHPLTAGSRTRFPFYAIQYYKIE